jgi:hypothetical protein
MTDYSNWKVNKSVINYIGNDADKIKKANEARQQYSDALDWCIATSGYYIAEDNTYYKVAPIPEPLLPTYDEVKEQRAEYRRKNIDDKTAERSRKMANGTWTEEDEQEYLALDAEVTAYIEEHFPYPAE